MKLDRLPEQALKRMDALDLELYRLTEAALAELATEPGPVGDYVRRARPDLIESPTTVGSILAPSTGHHRAPAGDGVAEASPVSETTTSLPQKNPIPLYRPEVDGGG